MPGSVHTVRSSDELTDRSFPSSIEFPRAAGQMVVVAGKRDRHPVQSPTESYFPMDDRKLPVHTVSEIPNMLDESGHLRPLTRGAPGDRSPKPKSISDQGKEHDIARQKSQYYHEAFACRDTNSSSKGRVSRDSVVMAELRTNVIVSSIPQTNLAFANYLRRSKTNTPSWVTFPPTSAHAFNDLSLLSSSP